MKFCFLCGKEVEKLIKGYCEECYNKKFHLIEIPKKISYVMCNKCNLVRYKNKWRDLRIEDLIKQKIKIFGNNMKIRIKTNDIFHVVAKGFLEGSEKLKEEIHDINVIINKTICPLCSKKYGGYYEAILQLRGNFSVFITNFIDDQMILMSKKEKKAFYKIKKVKNGVDFYIGSKSAANRLAESLKKEFNAEIKRSFKIATRKGGKNIYRNIISVRI